MELRKVYFSVGETDGYNPEKTQEEEKYDLECSHEQVGLFHCWIPSIVHNAQMDKDIPCVCALIEDEKGGLHEVKIDKFRFMTPINLVNI